MNTYKVIRKLDGEQVYEYNADSPVEWNEYPFTDYDHVLENFTGPLATIYNGRRKITKLEWRKLLTQSEQKALDRLSVKFETMSLPSEDIRDEIRTAFKKYEEATIMDLDDPDQARGLGLMVTLGLMAPNRIQEILNG